MKYSMQFERGPLNHMCVYNTHPFVYTMSVVHSANRCEFLLRFFSVHLNIKEFFYLFNVCGSVHFNWIFLSLALSWNCFCYDLLFPYQFFLSVSVKRDWKFRGNNSSTDCAMCIIFNPIIAIKWKHNILFCSINHRKEEN